MNTSDNRAHKAFWGLCADMGCQGVVTLSTFLLTPLVLALTSKSLYGSWQAALSILSYLAMLDAGLGFSLVRLVAAATEKRGTTGLSSVASVAFWSFAAIGAIVLAAGFFVAPFVPVWFHVPQSEAQSVIQAYRIAAIAGAAGLPLGTFNGVLTGLQRTALAGSIRAAAALAGAVTAFILLECKLGISALALSNLTASVCGGLLALWFLRKLHPGVSIGLWLVSREEFAALWRVAGYFQLVRIAYIIALNTDPLIIASFSGAAAVTPYVITARMAALFSIVLADKAPSAVYPALAQMYARNEMQSLRRTFLALVYYSSRLALVGAGLVALLNPAFVVLWVGAQGYGGWALNCVFVYWVLLDTILRGTSIIPLVVGEMKVWAIASVAEAVINIVFSILLVRPFGLVGVAAGTAIARTLVTGLVIPRWSCKKIGLAPPDFFLLGVLKPAVRSLPAVALAALVAWLIPAQLGWSRLAVVAFAAVAFNVAAFEGPKWIRRRNWSPRLLLADLLKPDLKLNFAESAD